MSRIAKVNFIWSVSVLGFFCVVLAAAWFFNIDIKGQPIVHYLSILATILSITLSVFSIAFSYYSLTSSSEQWIKISSAIGEMRTANKNIEVNNNMLLENVINITEKIGELNGRQSQFINNLEALSNSQIQQKNQMDNNNVRQAPVSVDNLANKEQSNLAQLPSPVGTAAKPVDGVPDKAAPTRRKVRKAPSVNEQTQDNLGNVNNNE